MPEQFERDLNGLGERLNKAEVRMAEIGTSARRSEADIQSLFTLTGENAKQLQAVERSVAGLAGRIAGAVAVITILVSVLVKLAEHLFK